MNSFLVIGLSIISAYLIGSIPTSFILGKALKGVDIRQIGSGNVGATNVLRVVGKVPALIALIVDIAKGVFVVTFISAYSYQFIENLDYTFYRVLLAFTAICGHIWPVFLKFKGGKGVATTVGIMMVVSPGPFLLSGMVWLIVFFFTNYVSLASIALGIAFPIFAALLNQAFPIVIFAVAIAILNAYKHKSNIQRLVKREEYKTFIFKKH